MSDPANPAATPASPTTAASPATASPATTANPATSASPAPTADPSATASRTADFTAGPGGVMTDEVGVVTGDLTLRTELSGDEVTLHVQYKDADEWYVITGGRTRLSDPADLPAVHAIALGLLHRPQG
ncbi:hypothetical protein EV385_2506 [Krasilnikovia cinnamomea]|uniref:Uncharacterized protein n=1 Tax=Krasilnikovia cinnamomea TaxID=349313 RepID=A0A4V2G705_9ACTN|nr:hypothetical protein [Krasilnikovia cinnamomea]RZU50726.1 hypothetical protein EV385_2506 [Krasilnikovia cinnamomea]